MSAAREAERRRDRREKQIIGAHPRIGRAILALTNEPRSTRSWQDGAIGERALGQMLESLRGTGFGVLHDRRIPGLRANIDHLVIGPAGVFVIDAKRYGGKVERRDRGWLLSRDWRLYVDGRDRTKLVEGMQRQVEAVRAGLDSTSAPECRVIPVLCFVDSQWALIARPFAFGDVHVAWPKMLVKLLRTEGPLTHDEILRLERLLVLALPGH
jgi:hypothetical protein